MSNKHWSEALPSNVCHEALTWARNQPSATVAWRNCKRGDWMLWLLGKLSGDPDSDSRKKSVLATCACARLALPYVKKGEERPRIAIETAEAWVKGELGITREQVNAAANAVYAAAYAANAAAYAANAAANAANAAAYAAYAAARVSLLAKCADIVRQHYPEPPKL